MEETTIIMDTLKFVKTPEKTDICQNCVLPVDNSLSTICCVQCEGLICNPCYEKIELPIKFLDIYQAGSRLCFNCLKIFADYSKEDMKMYIDNKRNEKEATIEIAKMLSCVTNVFEGNNIVSFSTEPLNKENENEEKLKQEISKSKEVEKSKSLKRKNSPFIDLSYSRPSGPRKIVATYDLTKEAEVA